MNILRVILVLVASCCLIWAADGFGVAPKASGDLQPETLRIALLPDEDPASILRQNKGFADYLEKRLGCKIELSVPHDYSVMIESMRAGRLHLAYFGPASYILCKDKGTEISPFAAKMKNGQTTYRSVIIGSTKLGINALADISGKKMGYGDPASTSSHLIPKAELLKVNLQPRRNYEQVYLGSHDAVALAVQSGAVAAGGLSESIYQAMLSKGQLEQKQVKLLATSPAFPQYPWVWRNDLAPTFQAEIRKAFIELKDTAILKALRAQGFAAIDDKAYQVVRQLEKTVKAFR